MDVEEIILDLHKYIAESLTHPHNVPGKYRDNPKELPAKVGDERHGGVNKPQFC